jgi:hypothetical protein
MLAYSEIVKEGTDENDSSNIIIRYKNLNKYILCILRLALCSSSEILLDYPIEKLAEATANKCLEFALVKDKAKGFVTLEQVQKFVDTARPMAIFSHKAPSQN